MEKELQILQNDLKRLQDYYLVRKTRQEDLQLALQRLESDLLKLREQKDILEKVACVFQKTAEFSREQAKEQIEWLVTNALQAVFGGDIAFVIELRQVKNRTEADFFVRSVYEGVEVKVRPEQSRGGGIVDIIALALRFAMLHLFQPAIAGPIILDEPAKHVSEEYVAQVAEFLRNISNYFDRQVIMVTHNSYLSEAADTAYRVEMREGKSQAVKIK